MLERGATDIPALSPLADLPRHRRLGIVEEEFAKGLIARLARHLADRAAGDARLVEIDQQIGDTVVLRGIGLGTHQHEHVRRLHAKSEEHTSELQSLMRISYAVFCLK